MSNSGGPRAEQPRKRAFTPEYKLRILAEYDALVSGAERGALLRRESLYGSHIIDWRKARDAGALVPPVPSGPPAGSSAHEGVGDRETAPRRRRAGKSVEAVEVDKLRRQNEKLARELARTQAALEIMGKAHALLELLSESAEPTRGPRPTE